MAPFLYTVTDTKIVFSAIFVLDRLLPNVDWAYFMADPRVCIPQRARDVIDHL